MYQKGCVNIHNKCSADVLYSRMEEDCMKIMLHFIYSSCSNFFYKKLLISLGRHVYFICHTFEVIFPNSHITQLFFLEILIIPSNIDFIALFKMCCLLNFNDILLTNGFHLKNTSTNCKRNNFNLPMLQL